MSDSPKVILKLYQKLLLVTASLLVAVMLIEIAGRAMDLLPHKADDEYQAFSRRVGMLLPPYSTFFNRGFIAGNTEFEVEVQLNKLGFRGADVSKTLSDGERRVLLLGDSYTASWEVPEYEMWSAWLSRALNADDQQYAITNLGVPNIGTAREYLIYEAYGGTFAPDLVVVVMYVENDIADNGIALWKSPNELILSRPYFLLDDAGELTEYPWDYVDKTRSYLEQEFPANLVGWLNANSVTYRLLRNRIFESDYDIYNEEDAAPIDPLNPTSIPRELEVLFTEPDPKWEEAWAITGALLETLRDSVEADGAEFAVVLIPPHMLVHNEYWQFNGLFEATGRHWDLWYPQNRLMALANDLGIRVFNPTQAFVDFRAATGRDLFWIRDRHFDPTGSCVFGILIANWLMGEELVPQDSAYPRDPVKLCSSME